MKRDGIFICFTGIDGSGKSTQSNRLVENLSYNGIRFQYVYARSVPILFKPFLILGNFLFLRNKNNTSGFIERTDTKKNALKKHTLLSNLFYKVLLLDYCIQIFLKISLPLLKGKNIICDRYIYDTIITDIAMDLNCSIDETRKMIDMYLFMLPTPDIIFLIDLPAEIAIRRKDDEPSIDSLNERRERYLAVSNIYNIIIIDGNRKIDEIEQELLKTTLLKLEEINE